MPARVSALRRWATRALHIGDASAHATTGEIWPRFSQCACDTLFVAAWRGDGARDGRAPSAQRRRFQGDCILPDGMQHTGRHARDRAGMSALGDSDGESRRTQGAELERLQGGRRAYSRAGRVCSRARPRSGPPSRRARRARSVSGSHHRALLQTSSTTSRLSGRTTLGQWT